MAEPLVVAEAFGYRYPESERASLDDVTLTVDPGTFTVLAGVSGSGKSTLLRALCGLVPHFHGGVASGATDRLGATLLRFARNDIQVRHCENPRALARGNEAISWPPSEV